MTGERGASAPHDKARGAEAALGAVGAGERGLHRMEAVRDAADALHRRHRARLDRVERGEARVDGEVAGSREKQSERRVAARAKAAQSARGAARVRHAARRQLVGPRKDHAHGLLRVRVEARHHNGACSTSALAAAELGARQPSLAQPLQQRRLRPAARELVASPVHKAQQRVVVHVRRRRCCGGTHCVAVCEREACST